MNQTSSRYLILDSGELLRFNHHDATSAIDKEMHRRFLNYLRGKKRS